MTGAPDYNGMCRLGLALCSSLSVGLFFAPGSIFDMLGIPGHSSAEFIARRASIIVAGLTVTLHLESNNSPRAVGHGMVVCMGGLTVLGTGEWWRGAAEGNSILVIIVTEALMAAGFANSLLMRKAADNSGKDK